MSDEILPREAGPTVPIGRNVNLNKVKTDIMQLSGNFGLADQKCKDFLLDSQPKLDSFFDKMSAYGRTYMSSNEYDHLSDYKTWYTDFRYDNIWSGSCNLWVDSNSLGGGPSVGAAWKAPRDIPTAVYFCSWFHCNQSIPIRYKVEGRSTNKNGWGNNGGHYANLFAWNWGYLGGDREQLMPSYSEEYVSDYGILTFDTETYGSYGFEWHSMNNRIWLPEWNGVMGYEYYADGEWRNAQVSKR